MKHILFCAIAMVTSALMLTVIQAPISWASLAWISWVPFILACSPNANPRRLVLASYIISLCYWLGNLYWLIPVTVIGWIVFCLYTACHGRYWHYVFVIAEPKKSRYFSHRQY
jgi:hypothetical protein